MKDLTADEILEIVEQMADPHCDLRGLDHILYWAGNTGIFPDYVDSVSVEQAVLLWKLVESCEIF